MPIHIQHLFSQLNPYNQGNGLLTTAGIKIAISSVKNYSDRTLPVSVPSLLESGIRAEDIYIFEGGHDERIVEDYNGSTRIKVAHNSFDLTALIDIAENHIESEYWFLMHDTCTVGPRFGELVKNIPEYKPDAVSLGVFRDSNYSNRNIGAYKYTFILENKDKLVALKSTDYSPEGVRASKHTALAAEDLLLSQHKNQRPYEPRYNPDQYSEYEVMPPNPFGGNAVRRLYYFGSLDLYKYQANWGDPNHVLEL